MDNSLKASSPHCSRQNCFAYLDGRCRALTDSYFKGGCPFFKDRVAKMEEDIRCKEKSEARKAEKERRNGK